MHIPRCNIDAESGGRILDPIDSRHDVRIDPRRSRERLMNIHEGLAETSAGHDTTWMHLRLLQRDPNESYDNNTWI